MGPNENYIVLQSLLESSLPEAGTASELVENYRRTCSQVLFLGFSLVKSSDRLAGWYLPLIRRSGKILDSRKEMNAVSTKELLRYFSSSLAIFPLYFQIVMPRHVLSACYARDGQTT